MEIINDNIPIIKTNKYQTPITDKLLKSLPKEVVEQFMEYVTTVEFIKNLISPDRPYYKDLPRDSNGRAIVDITNPPILEDTDYFRKTVMHFQKNGCYTFLKPNSNPNSEYRKFWDTEIKRSLSGMLRESDGAWIPGYLYWFLNYHPMMVNKIDKGKKKAVRVEDFPFFFEGILWRFLYLNAAREEGHHAIELAKRGCGKSTSLSAIMSHNLILGESEESRKRVITVLTADNKEYLSDSKDGTLSKFKPVINFCFSNTPFPHLTLKNSPNEMTWQMGYKDEYGIERGSLNQVLAVSAKDDPEKLRGKRGWILYEEMGNFSNLLSLYDITRKSVEDGNYTFACQYLVGTSAEKESDFDSAKIMLYSPEGYNIKPLPNVYDKPLQGKDTFGYFFPGYINRAGCYNSDGISDVTKALIEILMYRFNVKSKSDPRSLVRVIAEDPITPAEAIIKVKASYFPVSELTERLHQIDQNPRIFDDVYVGNLVFDGNTVVFRPSSDVPLRKYKKNHNYSDNISGAIEIYQMPEKDNNGNIVYGRYIIGHDPVDNDQADSSSLSSTFVFDMFTDNIVAEYTGRKLYAEDNYEIVRKLCIFYNAKCCFESNKKGLYAYFAKMNCVHMLAETPEYLREKQLIKYASFGSNKYGINANAAINNYANDLIRDWLLRPITIVDKDNNEKTVPLLYTLKCRALIEECIAFAPDVNVDRIRALGMVMLYRQETIILYQGSLDTLKGNTFNGDSHCNDPFFIDNYSMDDNII